jgi:hypothetical protein
MSTAKQIKANRRNARRSTGPRTPEGKRRSSFNAMKHGVYSKHLITPDENDSDLARLERSYVAYYRPPSEFELGQVRDLAGLAWRLRRYGRMESEILSDHGFEQEHEHGQDQFHYAGAGWGFTHDASKSRALPALSQVEERTSRRFFALKKQLDAQLKERIERGQILPPPLVCGTQTDGN